MRNVPVSNSDRMSISRIFGHVNPDTYSPQEYAETLTPVLEAKLRHGPIKVVNSVVEANNRGVALTLMCAKTFSLRLPVNGRASNVNEVLHEHGKPSQVDFSTFLVELFETGEKLSKISLVDSRGQTYTFDRGDVRRSKGSLSEGGSLNLKALSKPRLREGYQVGTSQGMMPSGWWVPVTASTDAGGEDPMKRLEVLERALETKGRSIRSLGGFFFDRGRGRLMMEIHAGDKDKAIAESKRVIALVGLGDYVESLRLGRPQLSRSKPLDEALRNFIGETSPVTVSAASKLLASHTGSQAQDLGYQSFLRRTLVGKDTGHLMRSENMEIRRGALTARADLARLTAAMQQEGCDGDDAEMDDEDDE